MKKGSIEKICDVLNLDAKKCLIPEQDHTKNISVITNGSEDLEDVDGLVTNKKGFVLATKSADCTSLLMYDPVKNAIASVHSGWRGTVKKIAVEAVNKMVKEYNSNPQDIICCICPSIRECHFEVEEDVKDIFSKTFNYEDIIKVGRVYEGKQKYCVNTTKINKQLLKESGLKDENIIDCGLCTVCNKDNFHSYRAHKPNYGLNVAIISLK